MSFRKPFYRRAAWMAVLVCAAWLVAAVATVPASAHVGHPSKATKRLSAAAKVRNRADHRLVKAAHKLKSCVRHHGRRHCSKQPPSDSTPNKACAAPWIAANSISYSNPKSTCKPAKWSWLKRCYVGAAQTAASQPLVSFSPWQKPPA